MAKKRIEKNKTTNSNKKIFGAIALGLLTLGGSVLAVPYNSDSVKPDQFHKFVDKINLNPEKFLETENLGLKENFVYLGNFEEDSFDEVINAQQNISSVNEGAVLEALNKEDYDSWREALESLEGFPQDVEVMSKDDFDILVELRKAKEFNDLEMQKQLKEELGSDKQFPELGYI